MQYSHHKTAACSATKVLVVDDDLFVVNTIQRLLAGLGFISIDAISRGIDALAVCCNRDRAPDVVILDLDMPDMAGIDTLQRLGNCGFTGELVLLGGDNDRTVRAARYLAVLLGLRVIGTQPKPVHRESLAKIFAGRTAAPATAAVAAESSFTATEIKSAISQRAFVNHYQPKVNLVDGKVVGVEALVRWPQANGTIAAPARFIHPAEESGQIHEITLLVAGQALEQSAAWRRAGLDLTVAINITMDDLAIPEFWSQMLAMVHAAAIPPESIILEVTESQVMGDRATVIDALLRLRYKRFRISLDDFGTGHSVFPRLMTLPFDEIKIDRSYASNAHNDARCAALVRSSIVLAHDLRLPLVAEGVETKRDWEYFREAGLQSAQGYFIGRPMPAEALPEWISDWDKRIKFGQLCPDSARGSLFGHN